MHPNAFGGVNSAVPARCRSDRSFGTSRTPSSSLRFYPWTFLGFTRIFQSTCIPAQTGNVIYVSPQSWSSPRPPTQTPVSSAREIPSAARKTGPGYLDPVLRDGFGLTRSLFHCTYSLANAGSEGRGKPRSPGAPARPVSKCISTSPARSLCR